MVWKNKFRKILAIIDSNKFDYKDKIGEFEYIDIKNIIKNNTISEISAKKGLNILNEIKNAEIIKKRRYTSTQKELLNLFNDLLLDPDLTNKILKSRSHKDDDNEIENDKTLMSSNEDDENDKTFMSSNEDNENENKNEDNDDERMSQNEKNKII